ncbi:MAG: hypothetical protein OXM87_10740 [Truepera sp.]|nr:hypothetical protein [Truepera sp.]
MTKCRPHDWKIPMVGDAGLTCERCGYYLDFYGELERIVLGRIIQGRRNHYNDAENFERALREAFRAFNASSIASVDPLSPPKRGELGTAREHLERARDEAMSEIDYLENLSNAAMDSPEDWDRLRRLLLDLETEAVEMMGSLGRRGGSGQAMHASGYLSSPC